MSLPQLIDILLRRQRRIFWITLLVGVAATIGVTLSLHKQYTATSTLLVGENRPIASGDNAVQLDQVLALTYTDLLNTAQTTDAVVHTLPFRATRGQISRDVSFSIVTGTHLIKVTATNRDPTRAQIIANTYALTFVSAQQKLAVNSANAQLSSVNAQVGTLGAQVKQLSLRTDPASVSQYNQALNQLDAARSVYAATEQNAALEGTNLTVAATATRPTSPAKPRPKLYIALGSVLALVLATVAALLANAFDKRIHDEDELSRLLDVPILGRVPARSSSVRGQHAFIEAFHLLRANLQFAEADRVLRLIAITSPAPQDGKSQTVRELAAALAQAGADVIAVDADLRKPMLGSYFDSPSEIGLTNALIGSAKPIDALRDTEARVRIMTSGPTPPNPGILLTKSRLLPIVNELRGEADYVLIDTPPVTVGADASGVAAVADGVIMVLDLKRTRRDELVAARDQLARAGAKLAGVVLNRVPDAPGSYYYGDSPGDGARVASSSERARSSSRA
jgi:capsular exopolysaccharide synthesis family protein